jgi:hypothetical protein
MITRQAQIIAYIDDYKVLMIATLVVIPLLAFDRREDRGQERALARQHARDIGAERNSRCDYRHEHNGDLRRTNDCHLIALAKARILLLKLLGMEECVDEIGAEQHSDDPPDERLKHGASPLKGARRRAPKRRQKRKERRRGRGRRDQTCASPIIGAVAPLPRSRRRRHVIGSFASWSRG